MGERREETLSQRPTLYVGQGCYLKLANYHIPYRKASEVIHGRVIRHDVEGP